MAINKNFFIQRTAVMRNDVEVCTVRGLVPDDIAQVMIENASDVELLMESFEKDRVLGQVDVTQDDQLNALLTDNTKTIFVTLISKVPDLAAKLIALASDEPGEWEMVKKNFVIPLQFDVLTEIAKLTFVDANGFKAFLGNALALFASVSGQRETTNQNTALSMTGTAG